MFTPYSWPAAILHVDADAFFASVYQAEYAKYRGLPLVVGQERGIATAISYEARAYGIKRGMLMHQIKKLCPECVCLPSDFELFGLYSARMFDILRHYSPIVEEYSIDEAFVDVRGMRRPLRMSYEEIAQAIQQEINSALGIGVSVGISVSKSLAKIASSHHKPRGICLIPGKRIDEYLAQTTIGDVWGIGHQSVHYFHKLGIQSALDFAQKPEHFLIEHRMPRPLFEIWHELQGTSIYKVNPHVKDSYKSISRTQTFTPSTSDRSFLFSRTIYHIEDAFAKARRYQYAVGAMHMFLKTSKFRYITTEIQLPEPTAYPLMIRQHIQEAFDRVYDPTLQYRTVGCTISRFSDARTTQPSLFTHAEDAKKEHRLQGIYPLFEQGRVDFATALFDPERLQQKKSIRPAVLNTRFF